MNNKIQAIMKIPGAVLALGPGISEIIVTMDSAPLSKEVEVSVKRLAGDICTDQKLHSARDFEVLFTSITNTVNTMLLELAVKKVMKFTSYEVVVEERSGEVLVK